MGMGSTEERLSKELQGKRLICEASFSREEVDSWLHELVPKRRQAWNVYPTISAVATVGAGIFQYEHGDFWSALPDLNGPIEQSNWGQNFERYLQKHASLETFQELKKSGHRYIAPILAHGGVPQYCLPDFFELLIHHGDPEQPSSDFIDFLSEHQDNMANIDKPVQRFLLHGGEVAEEFVARCLALWQSSERGDGGGTHGLPKRVLDVFSKWYTGHRPTQRHHIRRLPKPEIRMSPGDLWVYLHLPRCDDHPEIEPTAYWEIGGKTWAVSRDHEIPLPFGDSWTVRCKGYEIILQGISNSEPALFFDPVSSKLIPNPRLRRLPERLWVVFRESTTIDPEPLYVERLPGWPNYVIAVFDLAGCLHLSVGEQKFEVRRPFFHCKKDPVVEGLTSKEGLPVFHAPPQIEWKGEANLSILRHRSNEGNIDIKSDDLQVWFDASGQYELILRGPLGQNIRKRFILIPGLNLSMQPAVMWPDTPRFECDISAGEIGVYSLDGRSPPFISHDPCIRFQVTFGETQVDLIANVPRLRWRLLMSSEDASEWGAKSITSSLEDLERADYPRLVCEMGQLANDVNVSLIGKHGSIQPPQGRCSAVSQINIWEFDLRMVRDEVRQSGLAEEFDILVQATDGIQLYRGTAMSVRPKWDLQDFRTKWRKEDEEHIIRVKWKERGNAIAGRWLVLIPLWRPWEGAIQVRNLDESDRLQFTWRLSGIRPGRYVVRAVHAPWGCEDWIESKHVAQQIIDVDKVSWDETFDKQISLQSVEMYTEYLLAHWYRPELVKLPPPTPVEISSEQIKQFLKLLQMIEDMEHIHIPKDGSGALNIFCHNAMSTSQVMASVVSVSDIWRRVLPSMEIVGIEMNQHDREFVYQIAFQYDMLGKKATRAIRQRCKKRKLSIPLQRWHKILESTKPPADEVIFLCERFTLFANKGPAVNREYEKLKSIYQCREAV